MCTGRPDARLPAMRSPLHLPKLLAATAAACALVPAAAGASTISFENGGYVYRGDGAQGMSLLVSDAEDFNNGRQKLLVFGDNVAPTIQTDLCKPGESWETRVYCEWNASRPLTIVGSEGNDAISLFGTSSVPDTMPVTIDGRGGNDQIKDTYDGSAGRTLTGGAGNDKIEGFGGNDTIDGGEGNDEVDGGVGSDTVLGGGGDDVMWGDHY